MSFFNSKPWAKIPTDLLENKAMNRAEKMLVPELKSAPVLLYLAGATKADDDGIFDIGDGEEFASLIKVESPENVRQVAEAMVKLRIFAHVPESSIFLFVEWEYTTRQAGKTLRNRFNTACELWKARQEEASFFNPKSTNVDTVRNDIKALQNKRFNTILREVNECSDTIQPAPDENPQNRREREDKRETEQKSVWNEDDETKRNALISLIKEIKNQPLKRLEDWDGYINWLQSLKDRVQPKQEWSEEDEIYYKRVQLSIEWARAHNRISEGSCDEQLNWLKSLRPQKRWKPSDEQMKALWLYAEQNNYDGAVLTSLYNDLKKK